MKLRKIKLKNVRSFLEEQTLELSEEISIIIGPNGGGKTNLLDTAVLALRIHLLKSWIPRHTPIEGQQERFEWVNNDGFAANLLEKHSTAATEEQRIDLTIEVTPTDVNSMALAKKDASALQEKARYKYVNIAIAGAANWYIDEVVAGTTYTYSIVNGHLTQGNLTTAEHAFMEYLQNYEVHNRIREEFSELPLSTPMIFLPVTRSSGVMSASVTLAHFNEQDYKRTVDAASSRSASAITTLAVGRMAQRFRELLEKADGQTKEKFRADSVSMNLTETLKVLGYDWDFECTDIKTNRYEMILDKQGSRFQLSAASSGERELLTYLFAIYALNVKDALIVIDEPELHLHPRWQKILMGLFKQLAKDTGNQFLMATHSPAFASPETIKYVSRVYSEDQRSRIVTLNDAEQLPSAKHLFSIVNSQNNERVFFADLVILVEGISDRIFFEALFKHFEKQQNSGRVFEVVSVGGKNLFKHYANLLDAFKVPFVVIADLDYVREVGDSSLKDLFRPSAKALKEKLVDDPTSIDAANLITEMDNALETADISALERLWKYIKARQSRLRIDLLPEEKSRLDEFLKIKQAERVFILSLGSLESYLPDGHAGKDLEKLIELVSEPNWWSELPEIGKLELQIICEKIPF
ncbi:MAG: AAA family ATPase [Cyclobacteriaceae bacterium]|nr:AAA family ATPase [Cyclobacteriaceae bacterium]